MIELINTHLNLLDLDVRKYRDARFMDQKVTPDVLSIIADCVLNYTADRPIQFTKDDIWKDPYFNTNVKGIFNKPDVGNDTTALEYDKFISQPLRTLAYAGVLKMTKVGNRNYYDITNKKILEFIAMKERNAYIFLYEYLVKLLNDSGLICYFDDFKNKCIEKSVIGEDFIALKKRFQRFILGNTPINNIVEVNRIFPKILNIYSCMNNIPGTIKGRLSPRQIYYTDLMYNRPNWRDGNKDKHISRADATDQHEILMAEQNQAYSDYIVQKAMKIIRQHYKASEIKDQWANGSATQVHHIFSKSEFPKLAHYLENLIKLTPTQHFTQAHPDNKTDEINRDYQLICLLAKTDSIETSLMRGEFLYRKESFIFVINTGLNIELDYATSFRDIKIELTKTYNFS